ncbi:telomere-associated protein Tap [Streptomyces termitum]|uniref:telomere-associated protein Tap n=1 Tax=Streptomyces termitum TaxID=67368 RepID=UPI0037F9D789
MTRTHVPSRQNLRDSHVVRDEQEASVFARVDALLESLQTPLPPPEGRARLRQRAHLTREQLADALQCQAQDIEAWESGAGDPQGIQRAGYARLLAGLLALDAPPQSEAGAPEEPPAPIPRLPRQTEPQPRPAPQAAAPHRGTRRRPGFPRGPLAVVDQTGPALTAFFADQSSTEIPADHLVDLLQWAIDAGIGRDALSSHDRAGDPLLVLTPAASQFLGLPMDLEDRARLRLPDSHPQIVNLRAAGFKLTRRGFGPWARAYLPVTDGKRASVQLAVTGWGALSDRDGWNLPPLAPAPLARLLGTYADRVLTPRGSTAVCGQELMTALRPPTRGRWSHTDRRRVSSPNPGALWEPLDPAPPEAHDAHPLAQGRLPQDAMDEEAWDWSRTPTDTENAAFAHVVGLDINLAFIAAASSASVGLNSPPRHIHNPTFDRKIPGTWLCDLSHIPTDPRLPSPFTSTGQPPTGPAWYATPTLDYAVKDLGATIKPLEAYLRDDHGPYLTPWYERLRDAYLATMAEAGIHQDIPQERFLQAMNTLPEADPALLALLSAIKATGKGGLGKLREGPRETTTPYQRWAALDSPTWRPDIRAAVISRARVNTHRKMIKTAERTGRYPLAVLSDCVVYPAHTPSALDVVPSGPDGRGIPGLFCLGVNPGFAKEEGTRAISWFHQQHSQGLNPARYIKNS